MASPDDRLRLIEALHRGGSNDEARAVHASFVTRLKTELDVAPSVEMIRLGEELERSARQPVVERLAQE